MADIKEPLWIKILKPFAWFVKGIGMTMKGESKDKKEGTLGKEAKGLARDIALGMSKTMIEEPYKSPESLPIKSKGKSKKVKAPSPIRESDTDNPFIFQRNILEEKPRKLPNLDHLIDDEDLDIRIAREHKRKGTRMDDLI